MHAWFKERAMKILQVVSFFPPAYAFGGPVQVAYQIAKEQAKKHEVVVYTSDAKDFGSRLNVEPVKIVDRIRVHYFRNLSLMSAKKAKLFITPHTISRAMGEIESFDVIHLHEYRTFQNIVMAHYAKKYGVPYVLQAHGSLSRIMAKQRLKWIYDVLFGYGLLRDAVKMIAISQTEALQYREMGVPEEKIEIIPNGIDLLEYDNLPLKGSFKKKFSIDDNEKIVLYVGRMHKLKGIDFLIKSFARLVENEDAKLVLAGADDGYLGNAKNLVNSLGCSDHVLFADLLSEEDKISAYVDSTIVVHPERFNVFGLVPLEAAACARPVIVCNENYMSKIVEEGRFGLSVNYGDVGNLAKLLEVLIVNDTLASEMGTRGRQFIETNYSLDKVVDQLEKVYAVIQDL